MNQTEVKPESSSRRFPRLALAVVAIGLLLSGWIYVISPKQEAVSFERTWGLVEAVPSPPEEALGERGSIQLARTSISALGPNRGGTVIFRVSGIVQVNSNRSDPLTVRCSVGVPAENMATVAPSIHKRAAWPPASEDLRRDGVPDRIVIAFPNHGQKVVALPIRDVFQRYTDSPAPTGVVRDDESEKAQVWTWSMPKGTGAGVASLGYAVVFQTGDRPVGRIECRASSGSNAVVRLPFRLDTWPLKTATRPAN